MRLLAGLAGLAVLGTVSYGASGADSWAKARSFSSAEIAKTTLEQHFGGGWRDLPFTLTADEEANVKEAVKLAQSNVQSNNGKTEFEAASTREALQALLKKEPHSFYVEFLLGQWETLYGDGKLGAGLIEAAYADAPAVLAQRFQMEDGRPLADRAIDSVALECNRVEKGRLDPSLQLEYFHLRTDADGFIYMPVYKTVYRVYRMPSPAGYDTAWPKLGWFETAAKVGILPAAMVTEQDGAFLPHAKKLAPPTDKVTLANGTVVTIEAVTDCPPNGENGWWKPDGTAAVEAVQAPMPGQSPWSKDGGKCFLLRFSKGAADGDLAFEFSAPSTALNHYTRVRAKDAGKPFFLYVVLPTLPEQVSIRIGEAAGEWKVEAERAGAGEAGAFLFGEPTVENGLTWIRVKHEKLEGELQLRALDDAGKEIAPSNTLMGSQGETYEDGGGWKLPVEKIKAFRVETRAYEWGEFGNIAVKAKG